MNLKNVVCTVVATTALMLGVIATGYAGTLDDVRARGVLKCGINTGLPGFAYTDDAGNWRGFDVAYCQAVAAAVLDLATKLSMST